MGPVLRNHNARVHSSTGFAPSAIRFGVSDSLADRISGEISQLEMLGKLKENIQTYKQNQSRRESQKKETDLLTIGNRFWFKNPDRKKSALEPINLGPYTLVEQDQGKVTIADIRGKRRNVHISEIYPFRGDE